MAARISRKDEPGIYNQEQAVRRSQSLTMVFNSKFENKCKSCGNENNIHIHHEIYPTTQESYRQAMNDGKIYPLCAKCHRRWHRNNKIEEGKN